jgi:A/G-specific adenine glycosylase
VHFFTSKLLYWHKKYNKRELPWKQEKDPYKIWLSEIILQQTRAEQGSPYYQKFIAKYPSIVHLAKANDNEVFKLWEGLGYYSRCKNLLATARFIANQKQCVFPKAYQEILALKGVGNYTAAAICSFAYNLPYAVVDGNVYRILARFFGVDVAIDSTKGKKLFTELANKYLSQKNPAIYNQAIMDFGATVCTPKNAQCKNCVLQKECVAFNNDKVYQLPVKQKSIVHQHRFFYFLVIEFDGKFFITQRTEKDIWQNLHQFYLIEKDEPQTLNSTLVYTWVNEYFLKAKFNIQSISLMQKQTLSHQKINGQFIQIKFQNLPQLKNISTQKYFLVAQKQLRKYAFPKFINQYLDNFLWVS